MDFSKIKSFIFTNKRKDDDDISLHMSNIVQVVHARNGIVLHEERKKNLVVTAGLNSLRALVGNGTACQMNYIGLSSGVSAPSAGDTDLGATVYTSNGLERATGTYTAGATGVFTMAKTFTCTADNQTVASAGLYTGSGAGALFAGVAITSCTLQNLDTLAITWTVNFS